MVGDGKIEANGGDVAPGGQPGKGGRTTLISESIEGNPVFEAKGGKHAATQNTSKAIYKRWWALILEIIFLLAAVATFYQVFFQQANAKLENTPCSIHTNNQSGGENTVNCNTDLRKPTIELKPFEINTANPSPEIGFDSVYLMEVISDYTVANLSISIRLPSSIVGDMWIYQDIQGVRVSDYSPLELRDGYAIFNIPNAHGEYHLVFGNKEREQLTIKDVIW